MSGFEAMPHDTYALVHEMTRKAYAGQAWPAELVVLHLRWLVGERTIGRLAARDFPTVRALADEWGWSRWKADTFIRDGDGWQDPHRRVGLDWLRGERARLSTGQEPDKTGQNPDTDNGQTPTIDTETGQNRTRTGQEPDSCARSSSGSPDHPHPKTLGARGSDDLTPTPEPPDGPHDPDPVPGPAGDVPGGEQAAPPDGPAPDALAGRARPARGAGAGGASAAGGGVKADGARTLYEVYHRAWPSRSATPTHDNLAAMRRILHECGGLERAGVYLAWVAQAEDVWARRIRGAEPWPDGTTKARLDAVSLSRNIPGRLDEALAWEARGRTVVAEAAPKSEPDRVAALVTMLEELADHGGDPERCADPVKSRKVLAVWYGHGGGPASVASLAMRDRTFALRDIATAMVRARMAQQAAPRAEVPRG